MSNPFIPGPIALYSNYPIQAYNYAPSQFFISNITIGLQTTITTTENHNYVIGQICRLIIPNGYGCVGLNEILGNVIFIPSSTEVILDINSQGQNQFFNAMQKTQPQIVAVGDQNSGQINAFPSQTNALNIPGSFINKS